MKRALGRVIACVLLSGTVTACGSDSGSGGGAGGATGGSGGATTGGTGGSATGGSGGSATGGSATGGSAGQVPCTLTVSGSVTGTIDCTDNASSEAVAIGAEPASLGWGASGETAEFSASFDFHLPNPPTPTTYEGGDVAPAPTCTLLVNRKDFTKSWSYSSTSPTAGGNCSMTLTSAVDDSSSLTKRYVIHGTATGTAVLAADQSTVELNVTF